MDTVAQLKQAIRNVPNFPEPGIQFKDITPLLAQPKLVRRAVEALTAPFQNTGITKVLGIEARGFILGAMVADHLGAGFVPVRKKGKLPHETLSEEYQLEYGTDVVQMHADAVASNDRVLIHDDVMATGGTLAATHRLVRRTGAEVVGCAILIELGLLQGRSLLDEVLRVHTVLRL